MRRFQGEKLKVGSRVALISSDALGNFVVATSLLQLIRTELQPWEIDYYGGVRTWELQAHSDLFDWSYPFHGAAPSELAEVARERRGYDLIINIERSLPDRIFAGALATENSQVCGPCSDMPGHDLPFPDDEQGRLWSDQDWTSPTLIRRHHILKTGFIAEILCRACYLEGPIPPYRVASEEPPRAIPPVLISTAGSTPDKLWPQSNWLKILQYLSNQGVEVGLLGAHPIQQQQFWKGNDVEQEFVQAGLVKDLRGKLTLPEVVGALKQCKVVVTLDNGILHLAAAVNQRTIGIYRYGIHRLWAPPCDKLSVVVPAEGCPVSSIPVEVVRRAVASAI